MRELKTDIVLAGSYAIGVSQVSVSAGHGFSVGDTIMIWEASRFVQCEVVAVATNLLTLCLPLPAAFTPAAKVVRGSINLAIDGSTPAEFVFQPYLSTVPIDICAVAISMAHTTEPDDGKFGGITALTNGIYFRRANGVIQNLGNHKTNQSFREYGYTLDYPSKAPSGTYATSLSKRLIDSHTQEMRVDPRRGDYIKAVVRDNLTGLARLTVSLLGSYTAGE